MNRSVIMTHPDSSVEDVEIIYFQMSITFLSVYKAKKTRNSVVVLTSERSTCRFVEEGLLY